MALYVHRTPAVPDDSATHLATAHCEFLDRRVRLAALYGVPAVALDSIEPWFEFHDPGPVFIQLAAAVLLLLIVGLMFTRLGSRHRLALFTSGFLVTVGCFSTIVVYKKAFGTSYDTGFGVLFAFYCVFIPIETFRTALVGIATLAIISVPEAVITGDIGRVGSAAISNLTTFFVLLSGRHIANDLWRKEVLSRGQLESSYRQLVQSEKMAALGRLAAGVAHELNNPLAIIASNVESIERLVQKQSAPPASGQLEGGAPLRRALQRLRIGTDRLCSVNELLREYVSPSHGQMGPSDVNRPIDVALSLVEPKASGKAVNIHRETDSNLLLRCDPQALSHVFVNLLENACDAVEPGGNIWLRSKVNADGTLTFRVQDDGPGMAESLRSRIGEPFVTTKEPNQGLGLGLALCKSIVEKHSGLMVLSNRNPGLEVTITFPQTVLSPGISSFETIPPESTPTSQQRP